MSRPDGERGPTDPFDPFGHWKSLRESGMDTWSKAMIDFVNSDAYAKASAEWLDSYLGMSESWQRTVEQTLTRTMTQFNVPTTNDIVRLADRLTSIELRLDDLDAQLDEIQRLVTPAPDNTRLVERLTAIELRLAEVQRRMVPPAAPPARPATDRPAPAAKSRARAGASTTSATPDVPASNGGAGADVQQKGR
jgi:hypothetical protein